jgi:hypothetical protein
MVRRCGGAQVPQSKFALAMGHELLRPYGVVRATLFSSKEGGNAAHSQRVYTEYCRRVGPVTVTVTVT